MKKKILGVGNALVDALYPGISDTLLVELSLPKGSMQLIDQSTFKAITSRMAANERHRTTGGSACNTIVALAHLGVPTAVAGKVGPDADGAFFADSFAAAGAHLNLASSPLPTGVASAFITPDGERTFATFLGAAATMGVEDIRDAWFDGVDTVYIEGYLVQNSDFVLTLARRAHDAGLTVCLDMASYNVVEAARDTFDRLLDYTDILFANEEEARAFTGQAPQEALRTLAARVGTAVVKTGKQGALAMQGDEVAERPAKPVPHVADTTAAGDYFAAGFLYARSMGYDLGRCVETGHALAGEIVQVVGTRLDESTWQRLKAAL